MIQAWVDVLWYEWHSHILEFAWAYCSRDTHTCNAIVVCPSATTVGQAERAPNLPNPSRLGGEG